MSLVTREVSDHEPDPDWTARFFNDVQDVSSEDMQNIWARILAGEVESPGRTSLRTLDTLKNMAKKDAVKFKDICNFVFNNDFIFYDNSAKAFGSLNYSNLLHLQDCGLVNVGPSLVKEFRLNNQMEIPLMCQNFILVITRNSDPIEVLKIPDVLLTSAGRELSSFVQSSMHMEYLRAFSAFLKTKNCNLGLFGGSHKIRRRESELRQKNFHRTAGRATRWSDTMTPTTDKRLIEVAFPLKQTSLDSVHEKNVRHGHISTLHIWPARRPLAASRAALIATLLPDPGDAEQRKAILERMAGRVVEKVERRRVNGRTVERVKEETEGGILHWGRENGPDLDWFRSEIREAYGGRAPKVLDPFAGGGAIPPRSDAPGMRSHRHGHQPGGMVHPQVYPRISSETGGTDPPPAHVRSRRPRFHGEVPQGQGVQGREIADATRTAGPR